MATDTPSPSDPGELPASGATVAADTETESPPPAAAAGAPAPSPARTPAGGRQPRLASPDKSAAAVAAELIESFEEREPELSEKVVYINRCAKVVKGGRRFSFSALVVSGDHKGKVGYGFGKANEVSESIRKASDASRKRLQEVALDENTIPHPVVGEFGGGKVLLRPASAGTGIIAGGSVRAVVEAAGIKDVLAKSLGSKNHANVVKATLNALSQLRSKDEIYRLRGKKTSAKEAI
jgi:small subunit ribosomal protein S5